MEYLARVVVRLPLRGGSPSPAPPRAAPAAHHTSRAPRATHAPSPGALPAVNRGLVRFSRPPPPRSSWLPRPSWHTPARHPRRTSSWPSPANETSCVSFAVRGARRKPPSPAKISPQPREDPRCRCVAGVTAGAAFVAAAATAAVDATEIDPPEGDRWYRGVTVDPPPPAPAPCFTAGALSVGGGTGGHTSVMWRPNSLYKYSTLPSP